MESGLGSLVHDKRQWCDMCRRCETVLLTVVLCFCLGGEVAGFESVASDGKSRAKVKVDAKAAKDGTDQKDEQGNKPSQDGDVKTDDAKSDDDKKDDESDGGGADDKKKDDDDDGGGDDDAKANVPTQQAPAIMPKTRKRVPINLNPLLIDTPVPEIRNPWEDFKFMFLEDYRVRSNIYDTIFFQQASEVMGGGPKDQTFNRLDVGLIWEVLAHRPETYPFIGNGWVEFLLRSGVNIDHTSRFFNLSEESGVLSPVNSLFQQNNVSWNIISYTQSLFKDEVFFTVGRIHPNQYIALLTVANDESLQFLNLAFDGGSVIPQIGTYAPALAIQVLPNDWFSFHGVVVNNDGGPGVTGLNTLGNGNYTFMADLIFKPNIKGVGRGRWHLIAWQSEVEDNAAGGVSTIIEQHFGGGIVAFFRYGYGNHAVAPAKQQVAAGVTILGAMNRIGDMFGAAVAWTDPSSADERQETVFEVFYRVQITNYMQITPDFQVVFNPADNPTSDPLYFWGIRLRTQF
ncbi:Carbohydrate-selective porin, OprB family [Poriferisphaera corsica]|uniref:Carbohydrate-selective porin, OprB family n=1 Tax=Poriferisphaera corsica TaxID=2528020 RepID=A0A517YQA9_9BACT|nr:carbohydrate porin [Poriferisphaera corsica]QDU32401.1 Carbohydrate-selective porin, OprB family [Poriferisphaera corsica]